MDEYEKASPVHSLVHRLWRVMSIEVAARVCHEAIRALQQATGDPEPVPSWDAATEEQRRSTILSVGRALAGASPEQVHDEWRADRDAQGWTWGPVKDSRARRHPCLLPYDQLPPVQQVKDKLFLAVVAAIGDAG
jgi:hypothetical protein